MSLKSAPYYWLECDRCGDKSTEAGDFSAWAEPQGAHDEAGNSGWTEIDGGDYCSGCWFLDDDDNEVVHPPKGEGA
jgi:hypothetical protein